VRDNVTGLVWEKKPKGDKWYGNQGLHDADDEYSWYSTDADNNGGDPGYPNEGNACFGAKAGQPVTWCNTEAFVKRVNAAGWCGFTDWRLPDRFELVGLADLSVDEHPGPAIDTGYFPDVKVTVYWTSSPRASTHAWYVFFGGGMSLLGYRTASVGVWLVRGGH